MKNSTFFAHLLAAMSLFALLSACTSDRNPVDYINFDRSNSKDAKTYIQLSLNPSSTRADANATAQEGVITSVSIYIFNSSDILEDVKENCDVANNQLVVETTTGVKTIYAVTANKLFDTTANMTLQDFENMIFTSTLDKLIVDNKFVMAGKYMTSSLAETSSPINLPSSNKFTISLDRLVAKVQVAINGSSALTGFGSVEDNADFSVFQTNDEMMLLSNNADLRSSFVDSNNDGTYDKYTFDNRTSYLAAKYYYATSSQSATFTAENCQYMSENIVDNPKSGNTTFVGVRIRMIPRKIYGSTGASDNYNSTITFYTLGLVKSTDKKTVVDYVKDDTGTVKCFSDLSYANTQLTIASLNTPSGYEYVLCTFENGYAYYRINIKDDDKNNYNVVRNKFYKIDIKNLKKLGAPNENYLRPSNPATDLSNSSASVAAVEATLNVSDWSTNSTQQEEI